MRLFVFFIFIVVFNACSSNLSRKGANISINEKDLQEISTFLTPLEEPQEGDWLFSHNEWEQSFKEYKKSKPICPNKVQNKIYLLPIGNFKPEDSVVINKLQNYLHAFFGLEIIVQSTVADTIIPKRERRIYYGNEQVRTRFVLDSILEPFIPEDAIVYMAITSKDLFPYHNWNYVFGEAYYSKRVGVSSIYRFKEQQTDSLNNVYFKRMAKLVSHEIAHMFSLRHCTLYNCNLNGSNSLEELDGNPLYICPNCLSKLTWSLQYNPLQRYTNLHEFCKENGLVNEAEFYMKLLRKIQLN